MKRPDGVYKAITTAAELAEKVQEALTHDAIAIDTETSGFDYMSDKLVGISFSFREKEAYYVPIAGYAEKNSLFAQLDSDKLTLDEVREIFNPVLASDMIKYFHNAKFDMHFLMENGFTFGKNVRDTMLGAWVLWNRKGASYGLKSLIRNLFGIKMTEIKELGIKSSSNSHVTFDQIPLDLATPYAAADADMTLRLANLLESQMTGKLPKVWLLENMLVYVLVDMERTGIGLDYDALRDELYKYKSKMERELNAIYQLVGDKYNIDSPKQLSELLFEVLKLPPFGKMGKNGAYSTSIGVLRALKGKHPVIEHLINYRAYNKLLSTYLGKMEKMVHPKDNKIHAKFSSVSRDSQSLFGNDSASGITTGRLASNSPNLQNIPYSVRRVFVPDEGCWLVCIDYSQQEVRLLAEYGNDKALIKAFKSGGVDIHLLVTSMILNRDYDELLKIKADPTHPEHDDVIKARKKAKAVTFGVAYGKTPYGFARDWGVTVEEAEKFINDYLHKLPGVKRHLIKQKKLVRSQGYVETFLGRRRYFDTEFLSRGSKEWHKYEKEAVNMPVQGGGADVVKIAMLKTHHFLKTNGYKSRLVLQIHDEIVFQVPDEELHTVVPQLKNIMEHAADKYLTVPMAVDVELGRNWLEIHEYTGEE